MGKHIQPPVFPVVMQAGDILQEPRQDNRCVSESLTDRESWLSVSKNEAVSFPAPLSVHSLPVHGQAFKPALSLFLSTSRVRVYDAGGRTDVFPANVVGGEHPSPLPGQDIAVPAEVLNGLKIMVAIRWYHPQHVPVRVQLHHRRRMVGHGKQRSAVRSTSGRRDRPVYRECLFLSQAATAFPPGTRFPENTVWPHRPPSEERQPAVPVFV